MTNDILNRMACFNDGNAQQSTIELINDMQDRIEQLEEEVAIARRTSSYWKMEHLEGNKHIEKLETVLRLLIEYEYHNDAFVLSDAELVEGAELWERVIKSARVALGEKKDE